MKRYIYLIANLAVLLFLISCNSDSTQTVQESAVELSYISDDMEYSYTTTGNTADEFLFLINQNPIDIEYEKMLEDYDGSNSMLIRCAAKYRDWWYIEMEVAYNQLLIILDEDDSQHLVMSQSAWEEYMKNKKSIEESFYNIQKYNTIGNLRKALSVSDEAEETKARACSLLEYLYILTGEINMVFLSEN